VQQLISALFDRWNGQPILVIGGGRSVNRDLPALKFKPACVISANEHGANQSCFSVDLYVNVDKIHCLKKIPMEQLLRPLGGAIVNRHSWADYRLPDWRLQGNTGLTAIALAALLGGNPVLVTGIDMWHGGRLYFHDRGGSPRPEKHIRASVTRRDAAALKPLRAFTAGANIRPLSGPLCEVFPSFNPAEKLPPAQPVAYRRALIGMKPVIATATRHFKLSNQDMVPAGRQLALSPDEAALWRGRGI
jgi:hypothetical protein